MSEVGDLIEWAYEELEDGRRVKAGIIYRAKEKMMQRRRDWEKTCEEAYDRGL